MKGSVVYAGFGIVAPRLGYDDYGERVRGRIALVLEHEPGERDPNSPFDGVVTAEPAVPIKKVLAAQDSGGVQVVEKLGASASVMVGSDAYLAMQRGAVDGVL